MAPPEKRSSTVPRSSLAIATRVPVSPAAVKACVAWPGLIREATTVVRLARTAVIRCPLTCWARSHQCEPMSAIAELSPWAGSRRQE